MFLSRPARGSFWIGMNTSVNGFPVSVQDL